MSKPSADLRIERSTERHCIAALSLLFRHQPPQERARRVAELSVAAREEPEILSGLFVVQCDGKLLSALWAQELPGKAALLWGPEVAPAGRREDLPPLLDLAIQHMRAHRICLIQSLPTAQWQSTFLSQHGFETSVRLAYLANSADASGAGSTPDPAETNLQFVDYRSELRPQLSAVIEATYAETLDAPQLNGMRKIGDIVDGYAASSHDDESRWWLVREAGRDVGCLLLADHAMGDQVELVYMGLVPEVRGRGWGQQLVRRAQLETRKAGRSRLILAVDAANDPAIRVYSQLGFQSVRQQVVQIMFLR